MIDWAEYSQSLLLVGIAITTYLIMQKLEKIEKTVNRIDRRQKKKYANSDTTASTTEDENQP